MSVLLTIKEAAAELSTEPVNILRLVALRRLPATKLDRGYKLTAAAIEKFAAGGAPGLAMPKLSRAGWFDDDDLRIAAQSFKQQALTAMQGAGALAPEHLFARGVYDADAPAVMSRQMNALLAARTQFSISGSGRSMKLSDAYCIQELQNAAFQEVRMPVLGSKPAELLYSSPERFGAIVAKAEAVVLSRAISQRVPAKLADGRAVNVTYKLSHSRLASLDDLARLSKLAF